MTLQKMNFSKETEVLKQLNCLLEENVCKWAHKGELRDSGSLLEVLITYIGAFLLSFLLANHLALLGSKFLFGLCQDYPLCAWTCLS